MEKISPCPQIAGNETKEGMLFHLPDTLMTLVSRYDT